jgi:hypothetical protein
MGTHVAASTAIDRVTGPGFGLEATDGGYGHTDLVPAIRPGCDRYAPAARLIAALPASPSVVTIRHKTYAVARAAGV